MIDEYQDTNGIQELITTLLSNGHNRFLVGDIKQSIYRFRQADPTIFLSKYHRFHQEGESDQRIDLNRNFRSDAAVLSSINYLFRKRARKTTSAAASRSSSSMAANSPRRTGPSSRRSPRSTPKAASSPAISRASSKKDGR